MIPNSQTHQLGYSKQVHRLSYYTRYDSLATHTYWVLRLLATAWGKIELQRVKVCPSVEVNDVCPKLCYPGLSNGMMFSIETLAGCVTSDLTTKLLVVRSEVTLLPIGPS